MKLVFVSQHLFEVEMRKERLDQASISCMIKNQRSSGLAGEIPFTEVFPELWVIKDEDAYRAGQVLDEELITQPSNPGAWVSAGCGEQHERQFSECWRCGGTSASS